MVGYGGHAQVVSQHPIELVDIHGPTQSYDVSYTQVVQQIKIDTYFSAYTGFSFDVLLYAQHSNTRRILTMQETHTHTLQQTVVIVSLQQYASLSDDTDAVYFPIFLS